MKPTIKARVQLVVWDGEDYLKESDIAIWGTFDCDCDFVQSFKLLHKNVKK